MAISAVQKYKYTALPSKTPTGNSARQKTGFRDPFSAEKKSNFPVFKATKLRRKLNANEKIKSRLKYDFKSPKPW